MKHNFEIAYGDGGGARGGRRSGVATKGLGAKSRAKMDVGALARLQKERQAWAKKVKETLEVADKLGLSSREQDFLASVGARLSRCATLSPKQKDWIQALYDRACASPW
jgi:hypothetical protein